MNQLSVISAERLPALVRRAASQLANATNAAEVLDARDGASVVYDAAKKAARMAKAKGAHDTLIAAAHRAQADALEIEAAAKRRLADEYDAAQERGEIGKRGDFGGVTSRGEDTPTVSDIGLTHKAVHDARQFRDAEEADPGITRRTLDERLSQGQEPTKAALREAVVAAAMRGMRPQRAPDRRNPLYVPPTQGMAAWRHLTGACRSLAEWATDENLELIEHGRREDADKPFHDMEIRAVRDCAAIINKIVRGFDAQ